MENEYLEVMPKGKTWIVNVRFLEPILCSQSLGIWSPWCYSPSCCFTSSLQSKLLRSHVAAIFAFDELLGYHHVCDSKNAAIRQRSPPWWISGCAALKLKESIGDNQIISPRSRRKIRHCVTHWVKDPKCRHWPRSHTIDHSAASGTCDIQAPAKYQPGRPVTLASFHPAVMKHSPLRPKRRRYHQRHVTWSGQGSWSLPAMGNPATMRQRRIAKAPAFQVDAPAPLIHLPNFTTFGFQTRFLLW